MGAPVVYRSAHPDVLTAWDEIQRRYRVFHAEVGTWAKGYPKHQVLQNRSSGSVFTTGLRGDESPGPGWRYVKTRDAWYPDKRLKIGKVLAAEVDALKITRLGNIPGMPGDVFEMGHWWSPGVKLMDGALWANWSDECGYERVERRGFDASMWERAKASDYYRAVENAA